MKEIEHDPEEPPRDRSGNWPYWASALVIAGLWVGNLALFDLDSHSLILGAATGGFFALAMVGYTGNRVPNWMRR